LDIALRVSDFQIKALAAILNFHTAEVLPIHQVNLRLAYVKVKIPRINFNSNAGIPANVIDKQSHHRFDPAALPGSRRDEQREPMVTRFRQCNKSTTML
jgi:hypothetical protein